MKTPFLLTFLLFSALCAVSSGFFLDDPKLSKKWQICLTEIDISEGEIEYYVNNVDRTLGCVYACVLQKIDIMEWNNTIDTEKLTQLVLRQDRRGEYNEMTRKLKFKIQSCVNEVKKLEDSCLVALELEKCIMEYIRNRHEYFPGHIIPED